MLRLILATAASSTATMASSSVARRTLLYHLPIPRQSSSRVTNGTVVVRHLSSFPADSSSASSTSTTRRKQRPIYVAATRQHVGKTSVSLALVSHFTKRFGVANVGYMKAVGQQCLRVWEEPPPSSSSSLKEEGHYVVIDKDVKLIRDHFRLHHLQYADMSPILIPQGYTKSYLDGHIDHDQQIADIRRAYLNIVEATTGNKSKLYSDGSSVDKGLSITICEGTGHAGVGSIVGTGNARVAEELGADVVLVANGGLGKAFDELQLNRALFLVSEESCSSISDALLLTTLITLLLHALLQYSRYKAIRSQYCRSYHQQSST